MNSIKYIFTDLDGTLFKSSSENDKKIDPKFAHTINSLPNYGINFSIATGRDYLNAKKILELNGINNYDYIIGCNGAQIYNRSLNQLIFVRTFTEQEHNYAMKAFEYIDRKYPNQLYMYGYSLGKTLTHITFYIKENENINVLQSTNYMLNRFKETGIGLLVRSSFSTSLLKNAYKITIAFVDYKMPIEKRLHITSDLQAKFPDLSYLTTSTIEITPKNIDKYAAIQMINKKYYKGNNEEFAVFGDGGNDISMLYNFNNSFSRHDTYPFVKNVAKNIIENKSSYFVEDVINKIIKEKNNLN